MMWCPFCGTNEGQLHDSACVLFALDHDTQRYILAERQIENILDNLQPEQRANLISRLARIYNANQPDDSSR